MHKSVLICPRCYGINKINTLDHCDYCGVKVIDLENENFIEVDENIATIIQNFNIGEFKTNNSCEGEVCKDKNDNGEYIFGCSSPYISFAKLSYSKVMFLASLCLENSYLRFEFEKVDTILYNAYITLSHNIINNLFDISLVNYEESIEKFENYKFLWISSMKHVSDICLTKGSNY